MLLSITTTHQPATDLGHLLHKHPDRLQTFAMNFGPISTGEAHVFYPEASVESCTAVLLLEVDPIGRDRSAFEKESVLNQLISNRPYAASSFLSVAMLKVFKTAMTGRSKDRQDLARTSIPLTVSIPVLPCRGGEFFLQQIFEPLGYEVTGRAIPLDKTFSDWGESNYLSVTLKNTVRLADLLNHLCMLIPALDDEKHDWLAAEDINKLWQRGEEWLAMHPAREVITQRYQQKTSRYPNTPVARLQEDISFDPEAEERERVWKVIAAKKPNNLQQRRLTAVGEALKRYGAKRVVDFGCGEGDLLQNLSEDDFFEKIVGVDVSEGAIAQAKKKLSLDDTSEPQRVQVLQGSLLYEDERLEGFDALAILEVVEHIDCDRLPEFEQVVFGHLQPKTIILTTPNAEYNVRYPMPLNTFRDPDHRFEWTRQAFQEWAAAIAKQYGYTLEITGIGDEYFELGTPTQMGVFYK